MRAWRLLAALAAVAALALPAGSASAAAAFDAHLTAPNHHPRGGQKDWRITVTARSKAGRPLRATAVYRFLFGGRVVSTQYPDPKRPEGGTRPYAFTGRYSDAIVWPKLAAGRALTLRVVVAVRGKGSVNLDWAVRVRR